MKKRIFQLISLSILIGAVIPSLTGCKPTEKNYQEAYDAARKKKAADAVDPDMALPATGLKRLDAPAEREVNGEKLNVKHIFIKYAGKGEAPVMERYNVAVARYKMPTNAIAQSEDLLRAGYKAFPVEGVDGFFYVVAGTFTTLEEAAGFIKEYEKKHSAAQAVGLDERYLVIER